jgi:hypothetical protein
MTPSEEGNTLTNMREHGATIKVEVLIMVHLSKNLDCLLLTVSSESSNILWSNFHLENGVK